MTSAATAALRPALDAAVMQLSLPLSTGQADHLLAFVDLLTKWNATYNLTSVRVPSQMLTQHVIDCLAVIPSLQAHAGALAGRPALLDVGSGGGLPGVVIAAACPSIDVTCIDSVGKKAAFVRQVAVELGLPNLTAVHSRVESLATQPFDIVTSRAFASLASFIAVTRNRLKPAGVWLAMKGKRPDAELLELPSRIDVFHVEQLVVPGLQAERWLIWMRQRTAAG